MRQVLEFNRTLAMRHVEEFMKLLLSMVKDNVKKYDVVGSIRRGRNIVHDADIVLLVEDRVKFVKDVKMLRWFSKDVSLVKVGKKMVRVKFRNFPIDLYLTDEDSYEVVKLIRTGSKEFNIMLCRKALEQGLKLHADGTGLVDKEGNIVDRTERGIIEKLLGRYVPPEEREVIVEEQRVQRHL